MLGRLYDAGGLVATADLGLIILQGSRLGGGTVVNYTTSFRTPGRVREDWAREHGLPHFTSNEFTRSLDAVAQRIHVNTDHNAPSGRDRILIRGLERSGLAPRVLAAKRVRVPAGRRVWLLRHGLPAGREVVYERTCRTGTPLDRHGPGALLRPVRRSRPRLRLQVRDCAGASLARGARHAVGVRARPSGADDAPAMPQLRRHPGTRSRRRSGRGGPQRPSDRGLPAVALRPWPPAPRHGSGR